MSRLIISAAGVLALLVGTTVRAEEPAKVGVPDRATLEKQFRRDDVRLSTGGLLHNQGQRDERFEGREVHHHQGQKAAKRLLALADLSPHGGKDATMPLQR